MRVSVDDQVAELPMESNGNLSDVMKNVAANLPANRLITGILLDGQSPHQNPQTGALSYPAGDVKDVQIRTVDKEMWAANGIDISLSCVERIQKSLIRAAELFRERDKSEANHFFVHCIEGMERFIETLMITRCALRLDFNRISIDGITLAQIQDELSKILKTILECQEKEDFIALADKVEYELITNLYAWARALRQLRLSQMSNA